MVHLKQLIETAVASGALKELAGRIEAGGRSLKLTGAAGGARTLGIAAAILAEMGSTVVLVPSNDDAQRMTRELAFYLNLLLPEPPDVIHLPELEVDPYRGLSPHQQLRNFSPTV
ncbi:MAG: hypothetical protein P8Z37_02940 [Acidobacteriota bacterium]